MTVETREGLVELIERLRGALVLFKSLVQTRQPWTEAVQEQYTAARKAIDALDKALSRQAGDEWQQLRELSERATAGPWEHVTRGEEGCLALVRKPDSNGALVGRWIKLTPDDHTFIRACVNHVRSRLANSSAPTGGNNET